MTFFEDLVELDKILEEANMRHGNKKTKFETGAQRDTDEGKGKPSLISPVLIHRLGVLLAKGAEHYGADNWVLGMPFRRTADSIIRHIFQWLAGDEEEDHLAAICFGAMCLMSYEESYRDLDSGKIGALDDRCKELKKILPSILTSPASKPTIHQTGSCARCYGPKPYGTAVSVCEACRRGENDSR